MNISDKIKKVIKDNELKDGQFATTTGIDVDRVRNLCQGKVKKLQPHEKDAICRAYSVNPKWWEDETQPMYLQGSDLLLYSDPAALESRATDKPLLARSPIAGYDQVKVEALQPSAEWIVLTTMAISEAEWLPDSVKLNRSEQVALTLKLYQLLVMHLGDNDLKWKRMMNNRDALQHALHFAYDLDQMAL